MFPPDRLSRQTDVLDSVALRQLQHDARGSRVCMTVPVTIDVSESDPGVYHFGDLRVPLEKQLFPHARAQGHTTKLLTARIKAPLGVH